METPKSKHNNPANDSEAGQVPGVGDGEKKKFGRRLQDAITSKDPKRKLNLDRRSKNSDRRTDKNPGYQGRTLRYNIDRRRNIKDRRKND